jgi:hypothetical protein
MRWAPGSVGGGGYRRARALPTPPRIGRPRATGAQSAAGLPAAQEGADAVDPGSRAARWISLSCIARNAGARCVCEAHGFRIAAIRDGAGTEEGEPDIPCLRDGVVQVTTVKETRAAT